MTALLLTGCGGGPAPSGAATADGSAGTAAEGSRPATVTAASGGAVAVGAPGGEEYPDVVDVSLTETGDRRYEVAVTMSSPYDSPQRYADAWRVVGPGDEVLALRELAHDHAGEQPFTRGLSDVSIPADVDLVLVEGRDQANGWGGQALEVPVP